MSTQATKEAKSSADRIAEGVAIVVISTAIGTLLFPGPGTAIGAKIGALFGGVGSLG